MSSDLAAHRAATAKKAIRVTGGVAVQNGVPMMTAFAEAADIIKHTSVDRFDSVTDTGYQRDPQMPRIKKATEYYQGGGRMPNPILVNIREEDFDKIEIVMNDEDRKAYDVAIATRANWIGSATIFIPADVKVWVYDGQHRDGAISALVEVDAETFGDFPVPLSITLGLTTSEEMKEFYEVNQNAKSVKTDLAWELLRQMAEEDPVLAEALEISGKDWPTKGLAVAEALIESGGPWSDRIQRANVKKVRTDNLTLGSAQFARSRQPVLGMSAFAKADPATVAAVIDAYWLGISTVIPEAFTDPKKYVIQKGPGAIALHRVLPQVIDVLRARGERLGDPAAYANVLKDLPTLSGDIVREDGSTAEVTGADFWKAGPEGIASQWTGDSGRKRLAVRIQAVLPRPSDEINL
jgi:DGQHR domain-containing protein